jgi:hypothetical protein
MKTDKTYKGTIKWVLEENPLYSMTCKKCGTIHFMTKEPLIKRLIKWAGMLRKI